MKTIRQAPQCCVFALIGWALLANANFANDGPMSTGAIASASHESQALYRGLLTNLPIGWWQAEPSQQSEAELRLRKRLVLVAIVTSGIIMILGLLFAYLRMEYITRGFYSGRLQFIGVALTVVVIAVCYLTWLSFSR